MGPAVETEAQKEVALERLASLRWRVAGALTAPMLVSYFGFILLVAFQKPWMGEELTPGLSRGILLGALVIVSAWALTAIYVWWANRRLDVDTAALRGDGP